MEIAEHLVPTVTIECGGRLDEDAHTLAWQGLQTYFTKKDIFEEPDNDNKLKVYINPVRLEIKKDCQLSYADKPQAGFDLTLKPDIERFNYRIVRKGTRLGWLGEKGLSVLSSINLSNESVLEQIVSSSAGEIYAAQDLKLFMITRNPDIAMMDCLFYAAKENGQAIN